MSEEKSDRPTFVEHLKRYALRYCAMIGLAMGCASEMDGVIKVSSWVGYVTKYYRRTLLDLYAYIGKLINLHIPTWVWDAAVMLAFYLLMMTYSMRRGRPVDISLQTFKEKEWFVYRRVPVSVLSATTAIIFAGASVDFAIRFAVGFFPLSTLLFAIVAARNKWLRYQLDHEYIRFLGSTWLLIAILVLLSQTQVFEYLAGDPPPAPTINTPGPFGVWE